MWFVLMIAVMIKLVIVSGNFGRHLGYQCYTTDFATCMFVNYRPSWLFLHIETLVYRHRPVCAKNRQDMSINS